VRRTVGIKSVISSSMNDQRMPIDYTAEECLEQLAYLEDQQDSDDKECSGSSPSPTLTQRVPISSWEQSVRESFGAVDNGKKGKQVIDTTKSVSLLPRRSLLSQLKQSSVKESMPSLPKAKPPLPIAPKKKVEMVSLSISELDRLIERSVEKSNSRSRQTGSPSGLQRSSVTSWLSPHQYEWLVIVPYEESVPTFQFLCRLNDKLSCFGVVQVLANHVVLGMKQEICATLSAHGVSFGTAIKARRKLLSMSFEEVSTLDTSFDGWTAIQSVWKSKALPDLCLPKESGSPPTLTPERGTP